MEKTIDRLEETAAKIYEEIKKDYMSVRSGDTEQEIEKRYELGTNLPYINTKGDPAILHLTLMMDSARASNNRQEYFGNGYRIFQKIAQTFENDDIPLDAGLNIPVRYLTELCETIDCGSRA